MRAKPHRTLTPLAPALLRLLRAGLMHPYGTHQPRDHGADHGIKFRTASPSHIVQHSHRDAFIGRHTSIDKESTR
jgi:hypothetical protein